MNKIIAISALVFLTGVLAVFIRYDEKPKPVFNYTDINGSPISADVPLSTVPMCRCNEATCSTVMLTLRDAKIAIATEAGTKGGMCGNN